MSDSQAKPTSGSVWKGAWAETDEGVKVCEAAMNAVAPSISALLEGFKSSFLHPSDEPVDGDGDGRMRRQCLDIGCVPGSFTLKYLLPSLPTWCQRLVAVDNAPAMLAFAREKHPHPKIEYRNLDLMSDDEVAAFVREHGHFQRVYSFLTLHWITDQHHAVRNIEALMSPGGECFLVFSATIVQFDIYAALVESPRWQKYSNLLKGFLPPTRAMDLDSLRAHAASLVREASLCPLSCEVFHTSAVMKKTVEEAADTFTSSNAILPLVGDDEKAELRQFIYDFIDDLLKRTSGRRFKGRQMVGIHAYKPCN
ncbi:uncharacterized protein LOC144157626 [Haemaphysalis longicornis]